MDSSLLEQALTTEMLVPSTPPTNTNAALSPTAQGPQGAPAGAHIGGSGGTAGGWASPLGNSASLAADVTWEDSIEGRVDEPVHAKCPALAELLSLAEGVSAAGTEAGVLGTSFAHSDAPGASSPWGSEVASPGPAGGQEQGRSTIRELGVGSSTVLGDICAVYPMAALLGA